jgi:hypothetical protein
VIRNVVIHVSNEQPLLADLYNVPSPADVALVCTNIRTLDGKKPIFIDHADSTFFFPNLHIRFVEVPNAEVAKHLASAGSAPGSASGSPAPSTGPAGAPILPGTGEAASLDPTQRLPIALGDGQVTIEVEPEPAADPDAELDFDEDFLRRVRDI